MLTMPTLPALDRAAIAAGLDGLLGAPGLPDAFVQLRRSLWREQLAAHERCTADAADEQRALLPGLARLAATVEGPSLAGLQAALTAEPTRLGPWLAAARAEQATPALVQLAQDAGLAASDALFVGRILWAPLAYVAAGRAATRSTTSSGGGACPACGAAPALALIAGDGQRCLCCSLCGTRWPLARVACAFCGAERGLQTLAVQGDDARWIESCASCRRFIKTVDARRRAAPPCALVEAVAGLTLDLIAEDEGLLPAASYAAIV